MKTPRTSTVAVAAIVLTLILAGCGGVKVAWDPRSVDPDGGGSGSRYEEWTPEGFRSPR